MTTKDISRKLTAIFSADVEGYSRLMGEDEAATVQTLTAYRETMTALIQQHKGRVVDSPGDNLMAEFSSVVDAVQCAVEVQQILKAKNAELPENRRMHFRIGINLGDVIEEGDRIYGDGVNIASRVEGLAEGGGICISGTVYEHIMNKLALGYEYLGKHSVKNIVKPIQVYKVPMEPREKKEKKTGLKRWQWAALAMVFVLILGAIAIWNFYFRRPSVEPASVEKMAFPLPDKPSIAVLPFVNMSGDPEQEYIADGISENIITTLSKIPDLFVIARNSTFFYKGKPVKIKQVAEELGVSHILEGSVQKSGERVRVTAQLVDAIKGHHLWSERYDRDLKNFFEIQDEITKQIGSALLGKLIIGERAGTFHRTTNFKAWGYAAQGYRYYTSWKKEDNPKARELFKKAIEQDPEYGFAWRVLSGTHNKDIQQRWTKSPAESDKQATYCIEKALSLNPSDPEALVEIAHMYARKKQWDQAVAAAEKGAELGPNNAVAQMAAGMLMLYVGRFEEAIALQKKAMRLQPHYPPLYEIAIPYAYIHLGRYEEALAAGKKILERGRRGDCPLRWGHVLLAISYMALGREDESRAHAREALKLRPDLSLILLRKIFTYKNPVDKERLIDYLRKAGIPEKPPR